MNNKGMTVVELIVSFSLTALVVALLLQLLISLNKLSNTSGIKTELLTKQSNIEKQLYDDLEFNNILDIKSENNKYILTLASGDTREIEIDNTNKKIIYNKKTYKFPNNTSITNLDVQNIIASSIDLGVDNAFIKISIDVSYPNVSGNYNINVILPYNNVTNVTYTVSSPSALNYCKSLTYNGREQTLTKTNGKGYTFSGNTQIDAGTYTITATLANGYKWDDDTTEPKTFDCSINKKTITVKATNQTKPYDTQALIADSTCSVTRGSLVQGHTLNCYSTGSQTTAGSSDKTLETVSVNNGADVTNNYNITKTNGTLTVNKADFMVNFISELTQTINTSMPTPFTYTSEQAGTVTVTKNGTNEGCIKTNISIPNTTISANTQSTILLQGTGTTTDTCGLDLIVTPTDPNYNTQTRHFTVDGIE
ncbi:MAG: hypothetical protein IJ134_04945 [Bacilli bacterium]|nr:hypothetical protein [Bacilli bacterium]